MAAYVLLFWSSERPEAVARAAMLRDDLLRSADWRLRAEADGLAVYSAGPGLPVEPLVSASGVLLGRIHRRPDRPLFSTRRLIEEIGDDPRAAAQRLVDEVWGGYLAAFAGGSGPPAILPDPSGAFQPLAWDAQGVWIVASDLAGLPANLQPPRAALQWDRIAEWLASPLAVTWRVGLQGVEALIAGALTYLETPLRSEPLWSPERFARNTPVRWDIALGQVRAAVDHCTDALATPHHRLIAEVSGGLDSAIVASALAGSGRAGAVSQWLSYYAPQREGDERPYARAVAARLGVSLTEAPRVSQSIEVEHLAATARAARPAIGRLDPWRDADTAGRLRDAGATALLSGQGGDAVFFQVPTPAILADAWRAGRPRAELSDLALDLASWTRSSVWSTLRAAWGHHRGLPTPPPRAPLEGRWGEVAPPAPHPWIAAAASLPPGKRLQVVGLANAQSYRLATARSEAAEVVFPLLAQPVVELALGIPTYQLTKGGQGRAIARAAFADRLPAQVAARRSKGAMTAFYGRLLADSLDQVRPYLLDGCLCDSGLVSRAALDQALTRPQLLWGAPVSAILQATVVEAWIRYWQTRVADALHARRPQAA